MHLFRPLCLALLLSPCLVFAKKEPTPTPKPTPLPTPAPTATPAPAPAAPEATVLSVDDTAAIQAAMGKTITVEGKVQAAFWVKGTILLITFRKEESGFVGVAFGRNKVALNEAFGGDIATAVKGKKVRITGTVSEHNSRPQIVVDKAEQLKVVTE